MSARNIGLAVLFFAVLIPGIAIGGDDYVYSIPDIDGPQGGIAAAPLIIDAADDFEAFSMGVCFDESVLSVAGNSLGADIGIPQFEAFQAADGGFTLGVINNLSDEDPFPAGQQIEAYLVAFELTGEVDTIATLEFCELGDPIVLNEIFVAGVSHTPTFVNGSIEIENAPPPGNHVFWIEDFSGPVDSTQVARVMIDSDSDFESFSMAICHDEGALEAGAGEIGGDLASAAAVFYSVVDGGVTIGAIYDIDAVIPAAYDIEAFLVDYTLIGRPGTLSTLQFCELGTPLVESEMVVAGVNFTPDLEIGTVGIEVAAATYDLDDGETTTLILGGQGASQLESPWVEVTNNSGLPNQWLRITLLPQTQGIVAGTATFSTAVLVETSMANGDFLAKISIPFASGDVGKDDPLHVDLRCPQSGLLETYPLATSLNTADSPGHDAPLGDRTAVSGSTQPAQSEDLGDYGVFWNTDLDAGFAWANVDYAAEFVAKIADAPAEPTFLRGDTNGDGHFSGTADGIYMLRWAYVGGTTLPCMDAGDVNDNGSILAISDVLYLLAYAFTGGDAIPSPGIFTCGVDPTDDPLDCAGSPSACE